MNRLMLIAVMLLVVGCKPDKPGAGEQTQEARTRMTAHALQKEGEARAAEKEGTKATQESNSNKTLTQTQRELVVAKIGEQKITLGDVERQLAAQPAFSRARYRLFEKKVEFLNNLVQFELLVMEAIKQGYDSDPDVVLAMKRAMIQKFMQEDMQRLVTASQVTDEEIERYYKNNQTVFNQAAQIRASHILLTSEDAANKLRGELMAAIKADKARARTVFSEAARRQSTDRDTAFVNGDLNFFTSDGYGVDSKAGQKRISAPVAKAAFALKQIAQISPVIQSKEGYHIIQLTNKRPAVRRKLAQAKRQITNILLRTKKDKARVDYINGLRSKAKVTLFEENLKGLNVEKIQGNPATLPKSMPPTPKHLPALRRALKHGHSARPGKLPPGSHPSRHPEVSPHTDNRPERGSKP